MSDFELKTPVAFFIFNRPDKTERVFSAIARARPRQLLVVGDGARADVSSDIDRVAQTRALIARVDWPCDMRTNFSDTNLGCRVRVSSGLDWVFDQVEEAIILEDDCLPDPSFFPFCQELLERYRSDQRVGHIGGSTTHNANHFGQDSYFFSKYTRVWGWACWRDRWQSSYDVDMKLWPDVNNAGRLHDLLKDAAEVELWRDVFERVYQGLIDTWDFQWRFANWIEGRVAIQPAVNLVSNIGFGADAAHHVNISPLANLRTETLRFPLVHPVLRIVNSGSDRLSQLLRAVHFRTAWKPPSLPTASGDA